MSRRSLFMARCFLSPKDRKIAAFLQVAGAARAGFAEFASGKTSFAPFAEGRRPGGCRSWGRNGLRFEGCGMHCGSRVVERTAVRAAAACRIICRAGEGRSFAVRAGRMLRSPSGRGRLRGRYSSGSNISLPTPHSGQVQSSGSSSTGVPGAMPWSGSPIAGS